jgi:hypothetical protein
MGEGYARSGLLTEQRRGSLWTALAPFVVSRLVVVVATIVGSRILQPGAVDVTHTEIPEAALRPFFRFDGIFYHDVWQVGYSGPRAIYHVAFYPAYPALVRVVGFVLGNDLAALLISNACFLVGLLLVHRIALRYLPEDAAALAVWVLAVWPWAIFYSYAYGESLELALVAGAFLLMERGSWLWAGLLAGTAGASRPTGILTGLGFVGELVSRLWRWSIPTLLSTRGGGGFGRGLVVIFLGGVLSSLGIVAFGLILLRETGNPFAFLHAQSQWIGPRPRNPLFPVTSLARLITRHSVLDTEAPVFLVLLTFAAGILWSLRRLPFRYGLWGLGFLVVAVFDGYYVRSFTAAPRHLLVWFPAYVAVAAVLSMPRLRVVRYAWLGASLILLGAYAAMFGSWHFVS